MVKKPIRKDKYVGQSFINKLNKEAAGVTLAVVGV